MMDVNIPYVTHCAVAELTDRIKIIRYLLYDNNNIIYTIILIRGNGVKDSHFFYTTRTPLQPFNFSRVHQLTNNVIN